ncbi:MAG: hypothetical protein MI741_18955, partial [Rhodospirillales bacterium]|nr:hypothetical protein [Rhodospirillales bacterium]
MLRTVLLLCMLALVAAGLTGCVATAAYVNIPAEAGDVARNSPDAENVREVEAAALRYLELDRPIDGNIAISLPGGASELTHADVARRAGSKFVPPGAAAEAAATMVV